MLKVNNKDKVQLLSRNASLGQAKLIFCLASNDEKPNALCVLFLLI